MNDKLKAVERLYEVMKNIMVEFILEDERKIKNMDIMQFEREMNESGESDFLASYVIDELRRVKSEIIKRKKGILYANTDIINDNLVCVDCNIYLDENYKFCPFCGKLIPLKDDGMLEI